MNCKHQPAGICGECWSLYRSIAVEERANLIGELLEALPSCSRAIQPFSGDLPAYVCALIEGHCNDERAVIATQLACHAAKVSGDEVRRALMWEVDRINRYPANIRRPRPWA